MSKSSYTHGPLPSKPEDLARLRTELQGKPLADRAAILHAALKQINDASLENMVARQLAQKADLEHIDILADSNFEAARMARLAIEKAKSLSI